MSQAVESGTPVNLSATGTVSIASGTLLGFYVNSQAGTGTLVIRSGSSGTASGTAISGTITPAIGYHRFPAYCPAGCHFTIAVAALNVTAFFAAG
jgi:hypothetical protein